ncbi:DUF2490 domain-containing protein [Simkania negevensis]|uniref:DUF2490 domain-containing protein n=1 Tax=Simkania negevensis (strain ATCC VR-1471 / DSM 27360 / Z) TaxID=331113 RepID=F8L6V8_SIMNZ|nr:DUF2490 domain-containing protein [Simkania negevensis]CCB88460.1 hypothetical protein SNE_A05830 [Simkania negevensis Z]
MKKKFLIFFLFPISLFATVGENGDFQIWNENIVHFKIDPRVTLAVSNEYRWGDNGRKLFYKHLQPTLACEINSYITLKPGYRTIWLRASKGWAIFYDPFFECILHLLQSQHVEISNRNRITYSITPNKLGGKNAWQYRNRIHIYIPIKVRSYRFKLMLGDEVFFREGRGFSQNRAIAGFVFPRSERADFEFFYVYRNLKTRAHQWIYHNVLRLSANFYF